MKLQSEIAIPSKVPSLLVTKITSVMGIGKTTLLNKAHSYLWLKKIELLLGHLRSRPSQSE